MTLLAFTAEEINGFINAAGAIITTLVTIIVGYLLKRQANRVEETTKDTNKVAREVKVETSAQTNILKQQDETLSEHGDKLDSIQKTEDRR